MDSNAIHALVKVVRYIPQATELWRLKYSPMCLTGRMDITNDEMALWVVAGPIHFPQAHRTTLSLLPLAHNKEQRQSIKYPSTSPDCCRQLIRSTAEEPVAERYLVVNISRDESSCRFKYVVFRQCDLAKYQLVAPFWSPSRDAPCAYMIHIWSGQTSSIQHPSQQKMWTRSLV